MLDVADEREAAALIRAGQDVWRKRLQLDPPEPPDEPSPWHAPERSAVDAALGDTIAERWRRFPDWISSWGDREDCPNPRLVVEEVLQNCALTARPDRHSSGWNIGLEVHLAGATPLLNDLYERCRRVALDFPPIDNYSSRIRELENENDDDQAWELRSELQEVVNGYLERFPANWFFPAFALLDDDPDEVEDWLTRFRPLTGGLESDRFIILNDSPEFERLASTNHQPVSFAVRDDDDIDVITRLSEETLQVLETWAGAERFNIVNSDSKAMSKLQDRVDMLAVASGEVFVAPWVTELTADIARTATRLFTQMLPGSPELRCKPTPPWQWPSRAAIEWYALDVSGARVPLDQLSAAQIRLAGFALFLALAEVTDREDRRMHELQSAYFESRGEEPPVDACELFLSCVDIGVFLLDEPEAGVHTLAQQGMASALHQFGRDNDIMIIAATHSKAFLTEPDVNLFEVFRDLEGRTRIREVEFPEPSSAEALGVNRADLLQMYRLVLLVEGRHDQVVFDELLREELRHRYALVLPLRGAAGLKSVVDLQLLTDTLAVPVLIVLDGTRRDRVDTFWERLTALRPDAATGIDALIDDSFGPKPSDEERQVVSLARRLHERGELDRFSVFGLSRRDIVEYLPVQQLVPGADSWDALRDDYETYRATTSKGVMPFKPWLEQKRSASFGDDSLRIACAALDDTPGEFLEMLARIDTVADNWRRG